MENNVDPDQTPRSAASDLGLHCLLRHVCPNTKGNYGTKRDELQQSNNLRAVIRKNTANNTLKSDAALNYEYAFSPKRDPLVHKRNVS